MQMEKYHRLLIKKLKAEASHDYEQYAEAVASLDGFEVRIDSLECFFGWSTPLCQEWVAKYQISMLEDEELEAGEKGRVGPSVGISSASALQTKDFISTLRYC